MSGTVSYFAASLDDIAATFEILARAAEDEAKSRVITQTRKNRLLAQADTWKDAARMLRNTTLEV